MKEWKKGSQRKTRNSVVILLTDLLTDQMDVKTKTFKVEMNST